MSIFWKRRQKLPEVDSVLKEFVWLTRITNDTPTLISRVAEHSHYMALCSAAVNAENNTGVAQLGLYRDLREEVRRRNFSFDHIREKLTPVAAALGLHINPLGAMQADYYKMLGVSPDADSRAIKKAYRVRARQAHPDTRSDEKERFLPVHEAYTVLSDPSLRRQYDLSRKQRKSRQWQEDAVTPDLDAHAADPSRPGLFRLACLAVLVVALLAGITMVADLVMRQQSLRDDIRIAASGGKAAPPAVPAAAPPVTSSAPANTSGSAILATPAVPEVDEVRPSKASEPHAAPELPDSHAALAPSSMPAKPASPPASTVFELTDSPDSSAPSEFPDSDDSPDPVVPPAASKVLAAPAAQEIPTVQKVLKVPKVERVAEFVKAPEVEKVGVGEMAPTVREIPVTRDVLKIQEVIDIQEVPSNDTSDRFEHTEGRMRKNLEQFLARYCEAYENRDIEQFLMFFAENALENGKPIHELVPQYRNNFQTMMSIDFRIDLVDYTWDPEQHRIQVEGRFSLGWVEKWDKKWHQYSGLINMNLVAAEKNSFLVEELSYRFKN